MEDFRRWAAERGHHPSRVNAGIRLALRRLDRQKETIGIEREWGDLSASEKDRYLMFALRCERIILDRVPERECARRSFPIRPAQTMSVRRVRPRTARELSEHRWWNLDIERGRLGATTRDTLSKLPRPSPTKRGAKSDSN